MRIAIIFDRLRPDTTGIYFERALRAEGAEVDHWWLRDVARVPAGYDLYLRIDHGDDYEARWPAALRPSAFFVSDTHLPYNWPKVRRVAGSYGLMCYAQRDAAERLGGMWLPFAWDGEPAPARAVPGAYDVAFVGTEGGMPRKFILQALRERYARQSIGHADHADLAAIYGSAKIGFNYAIGAEVNMRIFEVLGAGALLVTNPVRGGDLARLGLREGEHYAAYPRVRDLLGTIDAWLADEPRRMRVAAAGAAVVRARHTYAHRARQLLAACAERLGAPRLRTEAACASS
jgi:hypothetical protein